MARPAVDGGQADPLEQLRVEADGGDLQPADLGGRFVDVVLDAGGWIGWGSGVVVTVVAHRRRGRRRRAASRRGRRSRRPRRHWPAASRRRPTPATSTARHAGEHAAPELRHRRGFTSRRRATAARPCRMQAGTPSPRRAAPATATCGAPAASGPFDGVDTVEVAGRVLGERARPAGDPDLRRIAGDAHRRAQVVDGPGRAAPASSRAMARSSPWRPADSRMTTGSGPSPHFADGPRARREQRPCRAGDEEAAAVEPVGDGGGGERHRDQHHRCVLDSGEQARQRRVHRGAATPPLPAPAW